MKFSEEKFSVELKGNTLHFVGKMENSNYSDVNNFLLDLIDKVLDQRLVMDIRDLEFSNSSGIRMLATFFMKTGKKIEVFIDPSVTWQKIGIIPLSRLKKDGEITVTQGQRYM